MTNAGIAKVALDEDVRPLLARLLRQRATDAVSVHETGRLGASDEQQLIWSTEQGRILVSHNARDFATLAGAWGQGGRQHAGLLLMPQAEVGWVLRQVLQKLMIRRRAADWINHVEWASRAPGRRE